MNLQDPMNGRILDFIWPSTFEDDFNDVFAGIAIKEL